MSRLILPRRFTQQPQYPAQIADKYKSLVKFAWLPAAPLTNLATGQQAIGYTGPIGQSTGVSGKRYDGNLGASQVEFYANGLDAAGINELTIFSIWVANPSQYHSADGTPDLLSTRTSGNSGWTWGRNSAISGTGTGGNLTAQQFTIQSVAEYTETNSTIQSLIDTVVGMRLQGSTVSWFAGGVNTSPDTSIASVGAGQNLFLFEQGPLSSGYYPWIDRCYGVVALDATLPTSAMLEITSNPAAFWQFFRGPRKYWSFASGGGGTVVNLSGESLQRQSATATLTETSSLTGVSKQVQSSASSLGISVPLSGLAVQINAAHGAVSVGAPLSGVSRVTQTSSGALQISVPLSAVSKQIQAALGALGVGTPLTGTSRQVQNAYGGLSASPGFSGVSKQVQSGSGGITVHVSIAGESLQKALASGNLTNTPPGGISLSGESVQVQHSSGLVGLGVNLSGSSVQVQTAHGDLLTTVPLSGLSAQVHKASGTLAIAAHLSAESAQIASSTGTLSLNILISGESFQHVSASGTLSTSNPLVANPLYTIYANGRSFDITAAGRSFTIQ